MVSHCTGDAKYHGMEGQGLMSLFFWCSSEILPPGTVADCAAQFQTGCGARRIHTADVTKRGQARI
jgi:hypothetical protein